MLVDLNNVDKVDEWICEYWEKWVQKCKFLPAKFFLAAHSFGGYQAALYASKNPEKLLKVFFISPAGFCPFNPENYDPYTMRSDDFPEPAPRVLVTKVRRIMLTR